MTGINDGKSWQNRDQVSAQFLKTLLMKLIDGFALCHSRPNRRHNLVSAARFGQIIIRPGIHTDTYRVPVSFCREKYERNRRCLRLTS